MPLNFRPEGYSEIGGTTPTKESGYKFFVFNLGTSTSMLIVV